MKSSIVLIEKNKTGNYIVTGYTAQGNDQCGYFIVTYMNKKQVACKGTPSSNYRQKFKKFPKHLLA